jgi:hypothetical protein
MCEAIGHAIDVAETVKAHIQGGSDGGSFGLGKEALNEDCGNIASVTSIEICLRR